MIYIPEESKVSYQSKDGKQEKVFDALEWVAAMCLTRVNRWSDTKAIIVMFHEASGKKKIRKTSFLISWNLAAQQRNTEKTGQDSSRRCMRSILSLAPNAKEG